MYQFKHSKLNILENSQYDYGFPAYRYMESADSESQEAELNFSKIRKEKIRIASQEMPQNSTRLFSVATFKKSMTLEEVNQLFKSVEDNQIDFQYYLVEIEEPIAEDAHLPQLGFRPLHDSPLNFENRDYNMKLNETYPELYPSAFLYSRGEVDYQQHFQSMLQYSIDHYESQMEYQPSRYGKDVYEEAYVYVEENGLTINAVYFISSPADLVELSEKPEVYNMEILDMELYVSR